MTKRAATTRPSKSDRVKLPAFGELLKGLRGEERSVQQVVNSLGHQQPSITTDQGTVSGYEQGYIKSPDPVILWGLAHLYGVSFDGLIAVLHANRTDRSLTVAASQHILADYSHGPSPKVAARALAKAEQRLQDLLAEFAQIREGLATGPETETRPRR